MKSKKPLTKHDLKRKINDLERTILFIADRLQRFEVVFNDFVDMTKQAKKLEKYLEEVKNMAERDIMNLPTSELTRKEIGIIKNFVRDAIQAGNMTRKEGLSRLKRFGISIKGMAMGGMPKKKKMANGGYSKPHNYFAGGSVTNNLKSK